MTFQWTEAGSGTINTICSIIILGNGDYLALF